MRVRERERQTETDRQTERQRELFKKAVSNIVVNSRKFSTSNSTVLKSAEPKDPFMCT